MTKSFESCLFLINLSMTCRKSFYVAFFWFAFITERRRRRRSSSNGNFLPWWKNWLRGTCFPLHSLITRHSKTCGSVITYELSGTARRPLNNDISFSISSANNGWLEWIRSGTGKKELQQSCVERKEIHHEFVFLTILMIKRFRFTLHVRALT